MNTGKVLLGVVAGLAAGATVGLLFAPEKGTDMRKKIWQRGEEMKDDLTRKFEVKAKKVKDHADDLLMT